MGNQQALTQNKRLARAQLTRELVDGLIEGDLDIVRQHLDEGDVDLECLADYACELNQSEIFMMTMTYLPDDANVDVLFLAAYEKGLVTYHDKEFMQEFLPVVQNRQRMIQSIWTKDDLGCFKLIKDDITSDEIILAESNCNSGEGRKILNHIVRRNVFDSETIKKLQESNTVSGRMNEFKNTVGKITPGLSQIISSLGIEGGESFGEYITTGMDMASGLSSVMDNLPKDPIVTLDKKIKMAIRKEQKNRIRHALRGGAEPKEILDYAYKYDKSEIYCLVAAYMSDEANYDKYYELGLRKGWYDSDDLTYQPKYVKPSLMETLSPMIGVFSTMVKTTTSTSDTKIPQKYKTAIRKFQKNRLRHIIRDDEDALEKLIIYSTTSDSRSALEYLMTLWPPEKDATKILGNICCQFNMFTLNDVILQYLHLPSDKKVLVQQCEISHNNDISLEIVKNCSEEERNEILQLIVKNNNLSLLKRIYDENLIPNAHKFLRKHGLKADQLMDTSSILQKNFFDPKTIESFKSKIK